MAYEITGHTTLTGLLGSPVEHSISPMMHNEAFRQLELDYAYLAFDVGTDKLETAVEGLKALGVRGFNLTMPDKNLMCSLADKLSPASEIGGAVNTVVNDGGILTGYTTDGIGFMRSVKEEGHNIIGKKMTLLGAGGAAAAILIQAALDGVAEIAVFNIRDEFFTRAQRVIEKLKQYSNCKIQIFDFSDSTILKREIADSAILVNGTSVGMAPNTERCIITDDSVFREELIVFDVIYNPEETLLLKKAKAAGCSVSNGLSMLLYQGAASFELWTGKEMPVEIIKEKYFSVTVQPRTLHSLQSP